LIVFEKKYVIMKKLIAIISEHGAGAIINRTAIPANNSDGIGDMFG